MSESSKQQRAGNFFTSAGLPFETDQAGKFPEYVKVCSLYGAGFYYIPGTDICLKIGGYVRFQQGIGSGQHLGRSCGRQQRIQPRIRRIYNYRSRAIATFDTRQQTAYGTLRTYLILGASQDSTALQRQVATRARTLYSTRAFIQIAGFTFGKATSFFDFVSTAAVAYNAGHTYTPDTGDAGHIVAAYTAQFGNGLSATISVEADRRRGDQLPRLCHRRWRRRRGAPTRSGWQQQPPGRRRQPPRRPGLGLGTDLGGGPPDELLVLRCGQPAGTAVEWNGHPERRVRLGGQRRSAAECADDRSGRLLPGGGPLRGRCDEVCVEHADLGGAVAGPDRRERDPRRRWVLRHGGCAGRVRAHHGLERVRVLRAFWTPSLRTSVYGSYLNISRPDNLNTAMCASGLFGGGATAAAGRAAGCDLDTSQWLVGSRSQWNITKDLYVGVDFIYHKVNTAQFNAAGTATLTAGALAGKAASASYTTGDIDAFAATWRIHRDIVP